MQTKAAPTVTAPENIDEFVQRYGKKPVTYAALFQATEVLMEALKALKTRADTLEQANADLSSRLLELEAREAAAHFHQ